MVAFANRGLERWLTTYVQTWRRRYPPQPGQPVHALLCIADHFEPRHQGASLEQARARLRNWVEKYPSLFGHFRDADGRSPRHSFFYPIEKYDEVEVDALAKLGRAGHGEVEIHLHHENDTAEKLRDQLLRAKQVFAERHGLLARHRVSGEVQYAFIHGDWALDNSHPAGCACGVDNELDVLKKTGCYADMTLPSAPEPMQTRKINSLYYATGRPGKCKGHDWGVDVGSGPPPKDALMLIQGPLLLNWRRRKWRVLPRIENACLQGTQPPDMERLDLWLRARVQVPSRPDWFFVKLHTHGAWEPNQKVVLGDPMVRFHEALARRAKEDSNFHYHYVTAREMYNLVRAAEAGWRGTVEEARDYELDWVGAGV